MSISQDLKTKKWIVKYRKPNGTQSTKRGFKTKKEAREWEFKNVGDNSDPTMTIQQLYDIYIDEYKLRRKESSYISKQTLFKYILPAFGPMAAADISPNMLRKWQNELLQHKRVIISNKNPTHKKGTCVTLSETTRHNICSAFSTLFNYGVKFHGLKSNPFSVTGNPFRRGQRVAVWTAEEFNKFISIIPESEAIYKLVFIVLVVSGMRLGELLALNKQDIDYRSNTITINKTLAFFTMKITPPKTSTSNRTIAMPASVMQQIKAYSDRVLEDNLFFFRSHHALNLRLRKYSKLAGVPLLTCHGLRHTHASMLINNNVPITTISKRLGHKNPKITLEVYSHFYKESDNEAAEVMDSILS